MLVWADRMRAGVSQLGASGWARRLFVAGIVLGSGAVLGGMLIYYWPSLSAYPWKLEFGPVALALVAYSADLGLAVLLWSCLMRRLGQNLDFKSHFKVYASTLVAGRIPGLPWHIAGRAALYKERGIALRITGVAAGLELVLIIGSGIWASLLVWPWAPEWVRNQSLWLGLVALVGLGLIHPRFITLVMKRIGQTDLPRVTFLDMLLLQLCYVLVWVLGGVVMYAVIRSAFDVPLTMLGAIIGAWSLSGVAASLAFISPTSLGIKEIALSLLLSLVVPAGIAVVMAIAVRVFVVACELGWALIASRL